MKCLYSEVFRKIKYEIILEISVPAVKFFDISNFGLKKKDFRVRKFIFLTDYLFILGDKVLGVGNCAGRLILFSLTCGLITSSSNFERRLPAMLGESALEASFMVS